MALSLAREIAQPLKTPLPEDVIVKAIIHPGENFTHGDLEVCFAYATYNHRKAVGTKIPVGLEVKGLEVTIRTEMRWAVVDLPNTYQPYLRIRAKR